MAELAATLSAALTAAGVPHDGVSIGAAADKATWSVQYPTTATDQQRATGATVLAAFNAAAPRVRFVSKYALASRLSQDERIAIRTKIDEPDAFLRDFWELLQLRDGESEPVDLDSATVIAGLGYLAGSTVAGHTISNPPVLASVLRVAQIRGLA